ncbi:GalNAc-alpha-(1-_4)-GalNAc-alpha-(1-_3)-diNAcBac-PP-undecaprenol alpha-1,4-N-acetyl-D-galactosaminyltransferase [Mycobacterium pseudokansasii]|uniref:GalNAc-alpha-(1->4)-GalNAc-alpha-(1->3)-diNAcBac-PP-undecaprenol alpha-1,4-N-acetyl-D-galactosaminyltransferase n=1 Tax=Mycobacterium pseudokansasii TaxID=2341080 RepID=A0A498QWX9_9MYCO|nr:GalNAc-alpha-(1->4)-GalNAc-alpha-(1->3)-diNAcBac-PP-undecaprenol alpha-1,4-N-acetyl-D-galactosaminyltransferase [Mycobacterium pseudokansasii]VBA31663.1 GalNAc-alpha-(1->4)-GalNAc-alpha-(1->3)-diNAcBac-PP-undecaprenol alpha-1,4-N-acetyl-D-galactosaminyltransferase [Mycobacterium pseudokansasii]VBA54206.1 GalNAc-alpha-(1->4)-GalNAc-alpha-(1->3)-diNAcBac-PP-undecaprenol alpha-1,4-N-acetyl-D-galactosaminyltransferase [Mycobacterium pseudokansasii]
MRGAHRMPARDAAGRSKEALSLPEPRLGENAPGGKRSTASVRYPIRVLTVGTAPTGPNSRGGMAAVTQLLIEDNDPRFHIRSVPTYVDDSLPVWLWTGISGMLKASVLLLAGVVDVLHVHFSLRGSVVRKSLPLFVARMRGIPTIIHCHSSHFFTWFDGLPAPLRRAVRAALRADYVVLLGESHMVASSARLGFEVSKARLLYNPVVMPRDAPPLRTRRPVSAVSLGRLGTNKGSYDLVRAIGLLPNDIRADLRVTLAGDGEVEQVREFVRANALDDTIDVVGWVGPADRDRLLTESAIFVLPSYSEGLPMSVLEAMANGVVPVTTPVGAIPEVVTDGVNGLLVKPGEQAQLAAALQALIVDTELRNRLAAAAYARARTFDVARWREALHDVWLAAATQRRSALSPRWPFHGYRHSDAAGRRRP